VGGEREVGWDDGGSVESYWWWGGVGAVGGGVGGGRVGWSVGWNGERGAVGREGSEVEM